MLARIKSGAVQGVDGYSVELEVHLGHGLISWQMAGLPDGAVREARMRVRSALDHVGYAWPQRPITVNLAPASIRKDGTAFDLPMALGLLAADQRLPVDSLGRALERALIVGELSLSGEVRPVRGVLPLAIMAREQGAQRVFVPRANADEAALVEGLEVMPVAHLQEVVDHARGACPIAPHTPSSGSQPDSDVALDLRDVRGQTHARRALEVAAAGGHNLLFCGPPGSGKTMLARRLPSILPALSFDEALEVTSVYSVAGLLPDAGLIDRRPFRTPHHTISDVGLVGGGAHSPRPGEVSLAHHGVLFLDELPEFRRHALEVLRQPLEDQHVTITRRQQTVRYPARVMLVAAMNGCPCGHAGSALRPCTCRPDQIERYRSRISGPLLDRVDLQVEVCDVSYDELRDPAPVEDSSTVRARVEAARARQRERLRGAGIFCNAQLRPHELRRFCEVDAAGHRLLRRVVDQLGMSARAHDRILKVARTIADLSDASSLREAHVAEAIGYRCLDRAR